MVGHVVKDNVLNRVSIGEIGDRAQGNNHQANSDMGPDGVQEQLSWLAVLRVDVQDSGVSLENCENFSKEEREVCLIKEFEVVSSCFLFSGSHFNISELIGQRHLLLDSVLSIVDSAKLKEEDGNECHNAATNENARED